MLPNENFPNANSIANDDNGLYSEQPVGNRVEFAPAPSGQIQAVLCDIRNLGMLPTTFEGKDTGLKPHFLFSWQIKADINIPADPDDDEKTREFKERINGQPYMISQRYTVSMGDKAKIRKHAEAMLGRKLTEAECKPRAFNFENLIGLNCILDVVHTVSKKDSKTYANVNGVMGWNTNFGPNIAPRDYVRFKDRPKDENGNVLKGEALQKLEELRATVRDAQNTAATYGVPIPDNFDISSFGEAQLRQMIEDYAARIKTARAALRAGGDDLGAVPASPTPTAKPAQKADPAALTPSEAFKKRTGHDPDIFAAEGEEGYVENDDERAAIIAEGKTENPAAVAAPKGIREAQSQLQAVKNDPDAEADDSNPFEGEGTAQTLAGMARAHWTQTEKGEFPAFLVSLFEAAEEAELPIPKDPLTNAAFIAEVNTFLAGENRKTITKIADLKAAPAGVVTKAIREGKIAF